MVSVSDATPQGAVSPLPTPFTPSHTAPGSDGIDPRAGLRGGCRIGKHPTPVTPKYTRKRDWELDGNRRDKAFRDRFIEAVTAEEASGRAVQMAIRSLFEFSDDTGKVMFPSQETMGALVGRAARTARRYCAELRKLGYLEVVHRGRRRSDGTWESRSAEWKPRIPLDKELPLLERADGSRKRKREQQAAAAPGRFTPSTSHSRPNHPPIPTDEEKQAEKAAVAREDERAKQARNDCETLLDTATDTELAEAAAALPVMIRERPNSTPARLAMAEWIRAHRNGPGPP